MHRQYWPLAVVIVAALLAGCQREDGRTYQGWVEAYLVFSSPEESGRLNEISVQEGEQVQLGAPLFTLDSEILISEHAVNQIALDNAKQAFERARLLLSSQSGTQRNFDDAEAVLRSAEARYVATRTRLSRRQVFSPAKGTVQRLYYQRGEWVPTGRAVVSILPPENLKARFFVRESMLSKVNLGKPIKVRCDGCANEAAAEVSFISTTAEYTPPMLYTLEERSKLAFMVEARFKEPVQLKVGQPLTITMDD
jgi:HlyD family secretion protein